MTYLNEDSQLELDLALEPVDPDLEALLAFVRAMREQRVVKAVGENGGLVIGFDPTGFCAALQSVRLPGELKRTADMWPPVNRTKKPSPPLVEVVVTARALRMRSQSPYITFETEFPLEVALEDLPAEGLAFKVDPRRLDPFFRSTTRSTNKNGDVRVSRQWQPMGFDAFEYMEDDRMIVLSREGGRFGLSVVPTAPSEPLPAIADGAGIALRSVGAIASSLTAASFVGKPAKARVRPVAVFKDGECSVAAHGRGVCIVSSELDGLDLAPYLDTPIKLATMLRRLDHPARLLVMDGQALADDGRRRCAFPVAPKTVPPITFADQVAEAGRSRWEIPNDEMLRLGTLFYIVAADEPEMEMDFSVLSKATGPVLQAEMAGSSVRGSGHFAISPCPLAGAAEISAFSKARVKVADFAKAAARLRGKRQLIAINSIAVILTDERDDLQFSYFVARTDLSEA